MTLQATADTWRQAVELLRNSNLIGHAGIIEPFVGEDVEGVVWITMTNEAARALLSSFGLSA